MLDRALALGFYTILEWGNNGNLSEGLLRPAITRRMQRYYDQKVFELSTSLDCLKHKKTMNDSQTIQKIPILRLQFGTWSNVAQIKLFI